MSRNQFVGDLEEARNLPPTKLCISTEKMLGSLLYAIAFNLYLHAYFFNCSQIE